MAKKSFDIVQKFKNLENREKFFLGACLLTAIGFVLPWFSVPLVGSFNGLFSGWGAIIFLLVIVAGGLVFYKPKYAPLLSFLVGGLLLIKFFDLMSASGDSEMSIFLFLGIGMYLTYLGAIAMVYFSIKGFKKEFIALQKNDKYFLCACLVTLVGISLPWISAARNVITGVSVNGLGLSSELNSIGLGLHSLGLIAFICAIITSGLLFYKPKYASIGSLVVGLVMAINIIDLVNANSQAKEIINANIHLFSLLGIGFYISYIGTVGMLLFGIRGFKKSKA